MDRLNSKRLTGYVKAGETKEITFDNDYGCLIFFYHPYFGVGLYGLCTYNDTGVNLIVHIQPQNSISLSLKGRTLKITSREDTGFLIFTSRFGE